MTSYPKNTNPLCGPHYREALLGLLGDQPQPDVDVLMLDVDGPIRVSAVLCVVHEPARPMRDDFGFMSFSEFLSLPS